MTPGLGHCIIVPGVFLYSHCCAYFRVRASIDFARDDQRSGRIVEVVQRLEYEHTRIDPRVGVRADDVTYVYVLMFIIGVR